MIINYFFLILLLKKMKYLILIVSLFTLSIQQEITLQSQPLDVIKCLLQSEVLLNDFKRIVELIKEKDYLKLIVELIEMYPSAYEEIMNCLQTDINLQSLFKECNLGKRDRCCWENKNDCCEIHSIFKKCNKVKTTCCKVKVTDPITRKTTIKYEKSNFSGGGGKF